MFLPRVAALLTLTAMLTIGQTVVAEKNILAATITVDYDATSILAGADGSIYVTGATVPPGASRSAAVVSKHSATGQELWRRTLKDLQYPGEDHNNVTGKKLVQDPFGNVVVVASTMCYAGFHSGFTIAKFDADGTQLWAKFHDFRGYTFTNSFGVTVDVDGNVYIPVFMLNVKEGPSPVAAIIKYDSQGDYFMTLTLPDSLHYGLRESDATFRLDVAVDSAKNVYVAGSGGVVKFDAAGSQIGSNLPETPPYTNGWTGVAVVLDRSDNVYLTGSGGTIKYSASGNLLWRNEAATGRALALDGTGNVIVAGAGGAKILDPLGTLVWQTDAPAVAVTALPTGSFYLLSGRTATSYAAN